ncbi:MAG: hypothetical protein PHN51_11800 [Candidatus Nanopelagicales bacterium]|nr:hypothetical protein [Candidatus Nanopelagicales bacterium]
MSDEQTKVQHFPVLDGGEVGFSRCITTGFSTDQWSDGNMDLSLQRNDGPWRWIDVGYIRFADPSAITLEDAATSPSYSKGADAFIKYKRSLTKAQACLVHKVVQKAIENTFQGRIPANSEIEAFCKEHNL